MNGKSVTHFKMTKREEVIHHYVLRALKEGVPIVSLAVIGDVNNAFMEGMLAYEQQHDGEEAKPKDVGYHPEIERRMLSVLDDVRCLLTKEEQGEVRRLVAERWYTPALRCLRHSLSRIVVTREGGMGGDVEARLRDIDTMIGDYGAALFAKVVRNPQSKVEDRLARIEGALNEIKSDLDWLARRSQFQHWVLVLMGGAIGAMAGVILFH